MKSLETFEDLQVTLPNGSLLHLKVSDQFYEYVRKHFELKLLSDVTHDHIRMFLYGAVNSALTKAEKEVENA